MGVRANLVLRRGGHTLIAYDKWAGERMASRVMHEAIFRPSQFPEGLLDSFAERESSLMNDVWCEGALLLDLDARRCLFFGGDGSNYAHYWDPALRADLLHLVQARLSGWRRDWWTVEWAEEGIASIADGAGIPRADVVTDREIGDADLHVPSTANARLLVLTRSSGEARCSRVASVQMRPGLSTGLEPLARGTEYVLRRWDELPPFEESLRESVIGGAIIDEPSRHLRVWQTRPRPIDFIRARWPGYRVVASTRAIAEQRPASTLMTSPAALVRYLASTVSLSGEQGVREALQGITCACGRVVGYGDVTPGSSAWDSCTTEDLVRRVAEGPPRWCGIVDGGEHVPMGHDCHADRAILEAFARVHLEHAARGLEANRDGDPDLMAFAARLRREHRSLSGEIEALITTAEDVLAESLSR